MYIRTQLYDILEKEIQEKLIRQQNYMKKSQKICYNLLQFYILLHFHVLHDPLLSSRNKLHYFH